jgi:hypothetical protein
MKFSCIVLVALVACMTLSCVRAVPNTLTHASTQQERDVIAFQKASTATTDDTDAVLLESIGPDAYSSNKGFLLHCVTTYRDDPRIPIQSLLNMHTEQSSRDSEKAFERCLASGGGHSSLTNASNSADLITDVGSRDVATGVELKFVRGTNHTNVTASNPAKVDTMVSLYIPDVTHPNTPMEWTFKLKSGESRVLHSFHVASVKHLALTWKVVASSYAQRVASKTIASNMVTLALEQHPFKTSISVFNDRDRTGNPVHLTLRIRPNNGTDASNLSVGKPGVAGLGLGHVERRVYVYAQTRRHVMTIRPVDHTKPWSFTFDYDWTTSHSPRTLFGLDADGA